MHKWTGWDWIGWISLGFPIIYRAIDEATRAILSNHGASITDLIHFEGPIFSIILFIIFIFGTIVVLNSGRSARIVGQSVTTPTYIKDIDATSGDISLRLRFFPGDHPPTEISMHGILSWYALWHPSATLKFASPDGKQEDEKIILPKTWTIILIFDRPKQTKQIFVSSFPDNFPSYEVKWVTTVSAIVTTSGDIPPGDMEISSKS